MKNFKINPTQRTKLAILAPGLLERKASAFAELEKMSGLKASTRQELKFLLEKFQNNVRLLEEMKRAGGDQAIIAFIFEWVIKIQNERKRTGRTRRCRYEAAR